MRWSALLVLAALAGCHETSGSTTPQPPGCALSTPGAGWLAFSSRRTGSYHVLVARADGSCVSAVTTGADDDLFPSFGPGGRIAYRRRADLRIHDLATGDDWPVALGTLDATSPAFSPDGTLLAFEGRPPGALNPDIYVVSAAGGDPVALTTSAAADAGPAWSPDGQTVYFVSTRNGQYDVYAVPAAGGPQARVTTGSGIVGRPAVSPDGLALYYTRSATGGTTEVVRLTLSGGALAVVTSQSDSEPAISPAGDRLAVRSFRGGEADLYVVGALDGAAPVRITADAVSDGAPSFAPALATTAAH